MNEQQSSQFDARIFLIALVLLCTAYAAARLGFELNFDDSQLITAESLAPEDPELGEGDTNDFFELHPDDSAGFFLGSAAILAGLLALIRPDPRVFLTALAVLTVAQLALRLGFAAVFGDASVISPDLIDGVKSAVRPDSVATAVAALVMLVVGMFGFAVLQTTVGFCIGPVSFPVYLLAVSVIGFVVGAAVARRATNRSRLQISLGAIVACTVPIAYAGVTAPSAGGASRPRGEPSSRELPASCGPSGSLRLPARAACCACRPASRARRARRRPGGSGGRHPHLDQTLWGLEQADGFP